jgi:hypothetical protein
MVDSANVFSAIAVFAGVSWGGEEAEERRSISSQIWSMTTEEEVDVSISPFMERSDDDEDDHSKSLVSSEWSATLRK